jgi:hypothetical protein
MSKSKKPYPGERRWVGQTLYGTEWVTYSSSDDEKKIRARLAKELSHYPSSHRRVVENVAGGES